MKRQELFDLKSIVKQDYDETSGTYAIYHCIFTYDVSFGNLHFYTNGFSLWLNLIAVICNSITNFEIQLYDYRSYIERQIVENQSYKQMFSDIRKYPRMCANSLFLKNMTIEEAQKMITDNVLAFHKFNEYIAEQKLIEQVNSI